MNKLFEQLISARNLKPDFLSPVYDKLTDPFLLPEMGKAVERIKKAISSQEKILIYGDYDVDGVTSSTLMEKALILSGADSSHIEIMLPDRFADGYGMSTKLVQRAKDSGTNLVITVDCGSRNHDIIDELNALKIDTIITDHHECEDILPHAIAIINPKRKDLKDTSLRDLAGVGVAFKVAEALKDAGLLPAGQEKWLLDLVVIGTICDNMVLTGENRILCKFGIKVLEKTRRPGLRELIHLAKVKDFSAESIGFYIGPRLNAAGRLETANLALELLRTDSATEAAMLAAKLEELNGKRRTEQQAANAEISMRAHQDTPVIVEAGKWHEGIIGIVAGRLVENYKKPAFVLTEVENGILKGSGRSFGDFNLAKALEHLQDVIISGGGHAGAAGVRLEQKNLPVFTEKINEYYKILNLGDQTHFFKSTADLDIYDFANFNLDLIDDIKTLEPFGPGNEEPIFCIKNATILEIRHMGKDGKHLYIRLTDQNHRFFKLIAFSAPESWFNLDTDSSYDFLVKLRENTYQGVRSAQGYIMDIVSMI